MGIFENILLALNSLRTNKLRAILTLLGIVIGLFSIIAIMTLLNALQAGIDTGLSQLGSNTFQIQKYPALSFGPGNSKYRNRPDITYDEGIRLKDRATVYKAMSLEYYEFAKAFKYEGLTTNPSFVIAGVIPDFLPCNDFSIKEGRFFTETEVFNNAPVCVIGLETVDKLFRNVNPLGRQILLDGRQFTIIGIYASKGAGFGQTQDNIAFIPITKFMDLWGTREKSLNIAIQAPSKETYNECQENVMSVFRVIRKVKPGEPDNFEIFSNESLKGTVDSFTKYFKYGAGVISFISLLAAGVGIMNIMLVSVTERTKEIGIRKAIGAKNSVILRQFLIEAIVLCLIGGVIGIFLGILTGNLVGLYLNSPVVIPYDWVVIGLIVCSAVGIGFGLYPAYKAAQLNPIDALRYE
ncbi:MAG: ABC transporter permease [Bacteroidetes bacterium]|nr:ABC transporter permease [Bacteroidota bacterium]MBX7045091.1 ABC transporter permease [Ignavibacteria bacterium]